MALRAGYYGIKRFLRNKLETIAGTYDETIKSLFPRSEQAVLGAKNLIPYPYHSVFTEYSGLTFTKNDDGSITINGTATEGVAFLLTNTNWNKITGGKYILSSGGAPFNGNFKMTVEAPSGTNMNLENSGEKLIDLGSNISIYNIRLWIASGQTLNNVTIYPMLRLASDTDSTYQPYAMTNKELTDSAADQKTAINAIINAATDAADFAAFKTAMGAITPVTRSLSLTKEDITEEVKEDVEPEKAVTKKRTTKKTEEV